MDRASSQSRNGRRAMWPAQPQGDQLPSLAAQEAGQQGHKRVLPGLSNVAPFGVCRGIILDGIGS